MDARIASLSKFADASTYARAMPTRLTSIDRPHSHAMQWRRHSASLQADQSRHLVTQNVSSRIVPGFRHAQSRKPAENNHGKQASC
jgi:hypothetical protein